MKVRHFNGSEPVNPLLIRDAYVFVTDSQGGKLLEYNPIELAGVVPLGGPRFCKTEIAQHIADLSTDQRDVLPFSATGFSIMGQQIDEILQVRSSEAILLPYFDGYQHPMDDTSINYNETTAGLTLVNASRKHQSLFMNKAAKAEIAKLAAATSAEPYTVNYLLDPINAEQEIFRAVNDFKGHGFVVIKPVESEQGQGVLVVPYDKLQSTLRYLLKEIHIYGNQGRIDRHAEKYWSKNKPSVFQVQEFVPANTPVHHKGRDWNATTRLVWSVLIGSDAQTGEETMLIKLHGGTYKLPRRDAHDHGFLRGMFGGHAGNAPVKQANVISYSQSHGVFESVFSLVAKRFGRGEHIAIKDPAALAHEGAKLAQDIETTFVYLESHSYADLLHQIGASSAVGREIVRDLKKSYPVNPAAEAVQAIYPQAPQPAG